MAVHCPTQPDAVSSAYYYYNNKISSVIGLYFPDGTKVVVYLTFPPFTHSQEARIFVRQDILRVNEPTNRVIYKSNTGEIVFSVS